MLPKAKYMKLSAAEKARVKARLGLAKAPRRSKGAVSRRKLVGSGAYATKPVTYYAGPGGRTTDPFSGAAAQAGQAVFGTPGKYIAGAGHWLLKKLTGVGAYNVNANTLTEGADPPTFMSRGRGLQVVHRVYW